VWQDAVTLGLLTALCAWHAHGNPWLPVIVFGVIYLGMVTGMLLLTRQWPACIALGFLWPATVFPDLKLTWIIAIFGVIAAVEWVGYKKSLRMFPWEFLNRSGRQVNSLLQLEIQPGTATGAPANVGWPFIALAPKIRGGAMSTKASFWFSALFGWWSYCAIRCFAIEPAPEMIVVFAVLAAAIRLAIYNSSILPSSSLWSRFFWGSLIVPGFDKVFLTPLAAVLISIAGGILIRRAGSHYAWVEAVVIALIWFVLFNGGPTRKSWMLTGHHRFRPPARRNADRLKIREV
jgi:hypothetical protein